MTPEKSLSPKYLQGTVEASHPEIAGMLDSAVRHLSEAIEEDPKCAPCYKARAKVFHSLHKDSESLRDYSTALRLTPKDYSLYELRSRVWVSLNKDRNALRDLQCLESAGYTSASLDEDVADILMRLHRWNKAIAKLSQALRSHPLARRYQKRANCYDEIGHAAAAIADLSLALEVLGPDERGITREELMAQIDHIKARTEK